jgi:hypothetical protein
MGAAFYGAPEDMPLTRSAAAEFSLVYPGAKDDIQKGARAETFPGGKY